MSDPPATREEAEEADRSDPLGPWRGRFSVDRGGPIYLDGNSLGRQPADAAERVAEVIEQWRSRLVGGWDEWIHLPSVVGDRIGRLVGAAPGQVVLSDSTTVNLYKTVMAAIDARPGRGVVAADPHDFPTVRYVLQGIAARHGLSVRPVASHPAEGVDADALGDAVDGDVAVVVVSGVNYRSGAVLDLAAAAAVAHRAGALTVWDLSHAAGAVPVDLDGSDADLAVGCSYKYLNGGPGAPAWLYASSGLQARIRQPIWGWWGQRDQFAMGDAYDPVEGVGRFCAGTPSVIGAAAVAAGVAPLLDAGMPALWAKTRDLVALLAERVASRLEPLGARLASPADPRRRGGHLAVAHPHARSAAQLLVERGLVVPDFRTPDVLRLAPVAAYTSFVEVWDAVEAVAGVLSDPAVRRPPPASKLP